MRRLFAVLPVLLLALLPFTAQAACATTDKTKTSVISGAISTGHAYAKHKGEFTKGLNIGGVAYPGATVASNADFATVIAATMGSGTNKGLSGGRHAWYSSGDNVVVIFNPTAGDCGTAFRPTGGISYYNGLS